jgi:hypothetical protein
VVHNLSRGEEARVHILTQFLMVYELRAGECPVCCPRIVVNGPYMLVYHVAFKPSGFVSVVVVKRIRVVFRVVWFEVGWVWVAVDGFGVIGVRIRVFIVAVDVGAVVGVFRAVVTVRHEKGVCEVVEGWCSGFLGGFYNVNVCVHEVGGQVGFVESRGSHEINLITCGWLMLVNRGVSSLVEGSGSVLKPIAFSQ